MNLYLIRQNESRDPDSFEEMLVVTENEDMAKLLHPIDEPLNNNKK